MKGRDGERLPGSAARKGLGGLQPIDAIADILARVRALAKSHLSRRWRLVLAGALGLLLGIGLLALRTSNAASYLSDSPETCINCHVMVPYYAGWYHSRHRTEATCNDCHVPHDNPLRTIAFKAMDGLRHATRFTVGGYPQTLRLNPSAIPVVQQNCVRCHEHQVMHTDMGSSASQRLCWECHRETPHGRSLSLSNAPHVRRPTLPTAGMPKASVAPAGVPKSP
jgi:cytochrome c nitrite reductase small subunit